MRRCRAQGRGSRIAILVAIAVVFSGCAGKREIQVQLKPDVVVLPPELRTLSVTEVGTGRALEDYDEVAPGTRVRVVAVGTEGVQGIVDGFPGESVLAAQGAGKYGGEFDVPRDKAGSNVSLAVRLRDPQAKPTDSEVKDWTLRVKANAPSPSPPPPADPAWKQAAAEIASAGRVYFPHDRHEIDAEGRARIQAWSSILSRYPSVRFRVIGHCNEIGTDDWNDALGLSRAMAIKEELMKLGTGPERLEPVSRGKREAKGCLHEDPKLRADCLREDRHGHLEAIPQ